MSIIITVETGAAPQGGSENIACSAPATRAAFQTAAATALSTQGGFILVTAEPVAGQGSSEEKLLNVSKIKAVI